MMLIVAILRIFDIVEEAGWHRDLKIHGSNKHALTHAMIDHYQDDMDAAIHGSTSQAIIHAPVSEKQKYFLAGSGSENVSKIYGGKN